MVSDFSTIWSAVAATCSAIAALSILKIQHDNMIDAARPEIVLDGWKRNPRKVGDDSFDKISIGKVINVGNGTALHMSMNFDDAIYKGSPIAGTTMSRISIIPKDEKVDFEGELLLWWNNVESKINDFKYMSVKLKVYCLCSKGYRYETTYNLMIGENTEKFIVGGMESLAPGVMLGVRSTTRTPIWRLKLLSRTKEIKVKLIEYSKNHEFLNKIVSFLNIKSK